MSPSSNCLPLPNGYQIEDYRIERQLSAGGFSFVYLATDAAGGPVAIKEYLPSRLAVRGADNPIPVVAPEYQTTFNQGMKSFVEEARLLSKIRHPNVVEVRNFIRANETAYMVMRYEPGHSLHDYVRVLKRSNQPLKEDFIRNVFVRLLSGLREVHQQKLLHLDLKPANIFLRDDVHPVLLDFGATRFGLGDRDPALGHVYTPGFAAPEQQCTGEGQGPWTDIYSIGATLYACLAGGETPQSAEQRLQKDDVEPAVRRWRRQYSVQFLELIDWCMTLPVLSRPQSVHALQKVLNGELLDLVDPNWFQAPEN
jgi:serine/threonine protein kinase